MEKRMLAQFYMSLLHIDGTTIQSKLTSDSLYECIKTVTRNNNVKTSSTDFSESHLKTNVYYPKKSHYQYL